MLEGIMFMYHENLNFGGWRWEQGARSKEYRQFYFRGGKHSIALQARNDIL